MSSPHDPAPSTNRVEGVLPVAERLTPSPSRAVRDLPNRIYIHDDELPPEVERLLASSTRRAARRVGRFRKTNRAPAPATLAPMECA